MKFSLILVSSLAAAIGSAEANPFGIKPPARPVTPSKNISIALTFYAEVTWGLSLLILQRRR